MGYPQPTFIYTRQCPPPVSPLNNYLLTIELIRDIHQLDLCIHGLGPEDISNKLVTFEYPAPAPH